MTDITAVIVALEASLLDVARQAQVLATGLQNAAPGDKENAPNKSVLYLFEAAEKLNDIAAKAKKLLGASRKDQSEKLHELIRDAVSADKLLRETYQIGDKFRFVRDRLNTAFTEVEENLKEVVQESIQVGGIVAEGEVIVYVYLFNAQGITLQTWHKMVSPSVFYEHSVNRPIYTEKEHIESFINRKTNKVQHGYLTIVIKKQGILAADDGAELKDTYGNPIIKVHEGSLEFKRLISFTHNGLDYIVDEDGVLIKKLS